MSNRLAAIGEELRSMAAEGLHGAGHEYDAARYYKMEALGAELCAIAERVGGTEPERVPGGNLGLRTPFVGVAAAIFNDEGKILLVQRTDNGRWCMPGGFADVGEAAYEVAERETWEETGLSVRAVRLIGLYDSQEIWPPNPLRLYHFDFLCGIEGGELTLTNETTAYGYFTEGEVETLPMHQGHRRRVASAFKARNREVTGVVFQRPEEGA